MSHDTNKDHEHTLSDIGITMALLSHKDYVMALYHQQSVEELFDDYAETFDEHLQKGLRYNVPTLLYESWKTAIAVQDQQPESFQTNYSATDNNTKDFSAGNHHVTNEECTNHDKTLVAFPTIKKRVQKCLDLGCGTGLAGAVFRADCQYLQGVDLSRNMCRQAHRKCIYDHVACGTLLSHMQQQPPASFDLITSADVFMYVLDLTVVLEQMARILVPGGWCVFSTESLNNDEPHVAMVRRESERFAHHPTYILDTASAVKLHLLSVTNVVLRMDDDEPVRGDIFVFQKPACAV